MKRAQAIAQMEDRKERIRLSQAEAALKQYQDSDVERNVLVRNAAMEGLKKDVELAKLELNKTTVRSPINGIVLHRHVEKGQLAGVGSILFTVLDNESLWVKIYVPAEELSGIKIGTSAALQFNAWKGRTFPGKVVAISNQAEFIPKNVLTQEERSSLVYAVKVKILEGLKDLKLGMAAEVTLGRGEVQ